MLKSFFLGSAALGVLTACATVGPDYAAPQTPLAVSFAGGGVDAGDVTQDAWWERLDDRQLNALIVRGLAQNIDIATALQRIVTAEAGLRQTGSAAQLSGGVDAQVQRAGGDNIPTATAERATFGASYILDLFGGARRGAQQAAAGVEAAAFDAGTVRLAFLSEITSNYIDARYFQQALALTRQNIGSRRRTLSLVKSQVEFGVVSDLNLAQAQAQVDTAIAALPPLEAAFEASVFAIATLLAEPAQPLLTMMQKGAAQPYPGNDATAGVPANLLRNRPDVRAAERRFAAAVAGVGVAEAQLYPSITLSGSVTAADASAWSFGPALSFPVLNKRSLRASRDAAISSAATAQLDWRAQVLTAVQDVQTAQSNLSRKRREIVALRAVQVSNDRVLTLSRSSFDLGELSLLDLLDAERAADASRTSLAAAVRDAAQFWTALMVATGRGWVTSQQPS
ncbi:efflux transporter outer membrane subunit [Loktanella sp. M215]|uniref:efflux transporter outer membrane subunit n=1 Tax=Loktanella sp. M215 TaxID=2675431 RepID=UPI001F022FA8|nr:efflux transporter outer membrane subunit [Loktanella sp. M215]MCF7701820.1 efflux transporter outer membrane subunit [Loktanella sp. M215]